MRDMNDNSHRDTDAVKARVGVVFPGDPRHPSTWSGTPAGLCDGLETAGVEVVPLNAMPGPALDRISMNVVSAMRLHRARDGSLRDRLRLAQAMARASPELARLRTRALGRKLTRTAQLDGLIQIGAGYQPRTDAAIAVFDDITVPQAVEL